MPANLRAFVAVPIPEAVTDFLHRVRAGLESRAMPVRWVAIDGIHLTIKFLGQIAPSQVDGIVARMDAVAAATAPFQLRAQATGAFPSPRRARVLWVGLEGALAPLMSMQASLESGLETIGFAKEERRFHPHLTIGRSRRPIDPQALGAALEATRSLASDLFTVDRVELIKSVLKPTGAAYTLLHRSHLALSPSADSDRVGRDT